MVDSSHMEDSMQQGDTVEWDWGDGTATGKIVERHTEEVTRTFGGTEVTRKGDGDDAAIVIEQEDGDRVLKLESEVRQA